LTQSPYPLVNNNGQTVTVVNRAPETVLWLRLGTWGDGAMSTAGSTRDRDEALYDSVRVTVEQAIIDVVGEEFYEECEVGLDSTFAEDIELESIEVMEIAEKLIETYGDKVDFVAWFADMELEDLVEITVGSVVDFIVTTLEGGGAPNGNGTNGNGTNGKGAEIGA
jgi:acyl carrier protein